MIKHRTNSHIVNHHSGGGGEVSKGEQREPSTATDSLPADGKWQRESRASLETASTYTSTAGSDRSFSQEPPDEPGAIVTLNKISLSRRVSLQLHATSSPTPTTTTSSPSPSRTHQRNNSTPLTPTRLLLGTPNRGPLLDPRMMPQQLQSPTLETQIHLPGTPVLLSDDDNSELPLPSPNRNRCYDADNDNHDDQLLGDSIDAFDDVVVSEDVNQNDDVNEVDQVPFDQVWNQQEFILGEDDEFEDNDLNMLSYTNTTTDGAQDGGSVGSQPFDEAPDDERAAVSTLEVSDVSAFSAVSPASTILSSQADLPSLTFKSKRLSHLKDPEATDSAGDPSLSFEAPLLSMNTSLTTSPSDPLTTIPTEDTPTAWHTSRPDAPDRSPPPDPEGDASHVYGEIPSDEDDQKRRERQEAWRKQQREDALADNMDVKQRSLATAGQRVTAEEFSTGPQRSAEDLGSTTSSTKRKKRFSKNKNSLSNSFDSGEKTKDEDEDSLFDFRDRYPESSSLAARASSPHSIGRQSRSNSVSGESSKSSKSNKSKDRSKGSEEDDAKKDDDDVPCLKTRTQEAFASRRKKASSPKPLQPPTVGRAVSPPPVVEASSPIIINQAPPTSPESSLNATSTPSKPKNKKHKAQVSFGKTNTIHHFEHECDMYSDDQDESGASNDEPEEDHGPMIGPDVEEALRDIFMIHSIPSCNPSSSPPESPAVAMLAHREPRDSSVDDGGMQTSDEDDDDGTFLTEEEEVDTAGNVNESDRKEDAPPPENDDVFFDTMFSMVGIMSAALGFTSPTPTEDTANINTQSARSPERETNYSKNQKRRTSPDTSESQSILQDSSHRTSSHHTSPSPGFGNSSLSSRSTTTNDWSYTTRSSPSNSPPRRPRPSLLDQSSLPPQRETGRVLRRWDSGGSKSSVEGPGEIRSRATKRPSLLQSKSDVSTKIADTEVPDDEAKQDTLKIVPFDDEEDEEIPTLEEDPRLLELAKQAAFCKHEVLGSSYDESQEDVNISDIHFVVVELYLPLGIIFQEDISGCWIAKVMPDGNAHKTGKVEPGDQLAAISGKTAIGMRVDDISSAITEAANKANVVELTFLRYVGPIIPDDRGVVNVEHCSGDDHSEVTFGNEDQLLDLDEQPQSTESVVGNKKKSTRKSMFSKGSPRRSGKKMFKWLGRGKRQPSKTE